MPRIFKFEALLLAAVVMMLFACTGYEVQRAERLIDQSEPKGPSSVLVFFVTNRNQLDARLRNEPSHWFGSARNRDSQSDVVYGVAEVVIPESHRRGEALDDSTPASGRPLNEDAFFAEIKRYADEQSKDALLFVHGYNNDFWVALRRTAQIAHDISFNGIPICFSWPANGGFWGVAAYARDLSDAEWSGLHLAGLVKLLKEKVPSIHLNVITHSMGGRVMLEATQDIERFAAGRQLFGQIVMAAPDVDSQVFEARAPRLADLAMRVTLYASKADVALEYSKFFHGYARAGDGNGIVIARGVRTVDVSYADTNKLGSNGHGYVSDNTIVLDDIREVLDGASDDRPGLHQESDSQGRRYWSLLKVSAIRR